MTPVIFNHHLFRCKQRCGPRQHSYRRNRAHVEGMKPERKQGCASAPSKLSVRSVAGDESRSCDAHIVTGKANQRSSFLNLAHGAVVLALYGNQCRALWRIDRCCGQRFVACWSNFKVKPGVTSLGHDTKQAHEIAPCSTHAQKS